MLLTVTYVTWSFWPMVSRDWICERFPSLWEQVAYNPKIIYRSVKSYKSDTLLATTKYLADIATYSHIKCLPTDNGTEFTSKPFQQLLVPNRIKHEQSAPYSPRQNGTAERSWRTLFSMAWCLLIESILPPKIVGLCIDGFSVYQKLLL